MKGQRPPLQGLRAALWAESLKAWRAQTPRLAAAGLLILPLVAALFMVILKDPERARELGLIGVKAQLAGQSADWPTFASILAQGIAVGGAIVFALIVAWVFGREFSEGTVIDLLSVPTARAATVIAKFVVVALWVSGSALLVIGVALGLGFMLDMPGWSGAFGLRLLLTLANTTLLTLLLLAPVGFVASAGRGYLAPIGWTFLSVALAQIAAVLGWGGWFPWAVPALVAGAGGEAAAQVGAHSYLLVVLVSAAGVAATVQWWRAADQAQ